MSVPSDVARMFRLTRVGDALIAVGMIGTIVFGIWLAFDEYEIWDGWIIAALVLWLFAAAVGGRVGKIYNGARDRANALVAEGSDAPNPELSAMLRSQRGLVLHGLMILVVVAAPRRHDLQAGGIACSPRSVPTAGTSRSSCTSWEHRFCSGR